MFGVMQGRLSAGESQSPQEFPARWETEFDLASSIGFSHMEWLIPRDNYGSMAGWKAPASVCKALDASPVPVRSVCLDLLLTGQGSPEETPELPEEDFMSAIKFSLAIGAEVIVLPLVEGQNLQNRRSRQLWVSRLRTLVQEMPLSEKKLAIEATVSDPVFRGFVDQSQLDLGFNLDTGNLTVANIDPASALRSLGPLVRSIHLKDRDRNGLSVSIGNGTVPFVSLFEAMREKALSPLLTLETPRPATSAAFEVRAHLDAISERWELSAS